MARHRQWFNQGRRKSREMKRALKKLRGIYEGDVWVVAYTKGEARTPAEQGYYIGFGARNADNLPPALKLKCVKVRWLDL